MADYLLGIDIGTSGAKALLMRAGDGEVIASRTTEYGLSAPRPLWSEQNPHDWHQATVQSVRAVVKEAGIDAAHIAAIGLTGQMHGLVLLDDQGGVLRPAILWNDQRTAAQCDEIHRRIGIETVIAQTGKPALPSFTAPKILWVREHEPEVFSAAAKMLLPKDYVRYRLTGVLASDVADASGTSLFDVQHRQWSDVMIDALDVPRSALPDVTESPVASAKINRAGAHETGLLEGTPVVAGAGDQAAEAIGCGIIDDGSVSVTIGTSGVVFAATKQLHYDKTGKLHAYCHAAPGMWHMMGVMLSAGGSLQWYRNMLCQAEMNDAAQTGVDAYDLLIDAAAGVEAGCEGLIFLPYLTGERTPHADPYARGVFFGLTRRHTKAHMTRAVLEGVSFGLCDSLKLLRELGISAGSVRASGGGARSEFWRQMLADVFDAEIATVNTAQGAALGAALLAGVGVGEYPSVVEACRRIVRITSRITPGDDALRYRTHHAHYRLLYPALAKAFEAVGRTAR